jgi:hypothetical protein
MESIDTELTTPELEDFDVMSVSEFSSKALRPFPSGGRFLVLELIVQVNYFIVVTDFC